MHVFVHMLLSAGACRPCHLCGGQRTALGSWYSGVILRDIGIKLRSSSCLQVSLLTEPLHCSYIHMPLSSLFSTSYTAFHFMTYY